MSVRIWRCSPFRGPQARQKTAELVTQSRAELIKHLKPFEAHVDGDWFIARTGYTGEDGLEIALPAEQAPGFFNDLVGAGISPIGLGARAHATGRGRDEPLRPRTFIRMSRRWRPSMAWSIAWEPASRQFIGRAALEAE